MHQKAWWEWRKVWWEGKMSYKQFKVLQLWDPLCSWRDKNIIIESIRCLSFCLHINTFWNKYITFKKWKQGWKDGSGIKSTYCSHRTPEFSFQHPQQPVTPTPGDLTHLTPVDNYTQVHIPTHSYNFSHSRRSDTSDPSGHLHATAHSHTLVSSFCSSRRSDTSHLCGHLHATAHSLFLMSSFSLPLPISPFYLCLFPCLSGSHTFKNQY